MNNSSIIYNNKPEYIYINLKHQMQIDSILNEVNVLNESLLQSFRDFDEYTYHHCQNVAKISLNIAIDTGMSDEDLKSIATAACLHDIGKSEICDSIHMSLMLINKESRLTESEFIQIQSHVAHTKEILEDYQYPLEVINAAYQHHEKEDGTGYPNGLSGAQISDMGKIIHIADVYDALISERSYKPSCNIGYCLSILTNTKKFDEKYVDTFIRGVPVLDMYRKNAWYKDRVNSINQDDKDESRDLLISQKAFSGEYTLSELMTIMNPNLTINTIKTMASAIKEQKIIKQPHQDTDMPLFGGENLSLSADISRLAVIAYGNDYLAHNTDSNKDIGDINMADFNFEH